MPAPVFDSAKQQRGPVSEYRGARVKNGMGGIRPIRSRQYWVFGMAMKKGFESVRCHAICFVAGSSRSAGETRSGRPRVTRGFITVTLCEARISRSDNKKQRVDSAP